MTTPSLRLRSRVDPIQRFAADQAVLVGGLLGAALAGLLVARGLWILLIAAMVAVPAFVFVHRHPLATTGVWLAVTPLVGVTDSGAVRRLMWLIHRGMPVLALIVILVGAAIGLRQRSNMRFGWPDLLAIGYLVATVLSLLYTGYDVGLSTTHIYDRIFVPVVLYLVVRLLEPDHEDLRRLVPILGFVLAAQAAIGAISWVAPGVLPGAWLNHTGQRTVGSLNETNLYGVTVLSCGLLLGHAALAGSWRRLQRWALLAASVLGIGLAVFTFSRAIWLALIVTIVGLFLIYPRYARNMVLVGVAVLSLVMYSGALDSQIELAQQRFRSEQSEESALSRVPVIIASLRMYQDRPVFGFGYENFDRFDLRYQQGVHNLYLPEKDHASHNVFLTIMAEQGTIGIALFLGPFAIWLHRTWRVRHRLPRDGLVNDRLVWLLWLLLLVQAVAYNFSRLQIQFGFGVFYLMLAMIGSVVAIAEQSGPVWGHEPRRGDGWTRSPSWRWHSSRPFGR